MEAVMHYVRNEWCMHLDDLMIRRTSWRYYHRDHMQIALQAGAQMAQLLNWTPERTSEELQRYESALAYNPPAQHAAAVAPAALRSIASAVA
jgi:glycerol-3-phosphate dehydrogenase